MKNTKSYIDYSQAIDDVYEYLEDYYLTKKTRVFIVFDDMIADMDSNKKLSPIDLILNLISKDLKLQS